MKKHKHRWGGWYLYATDQSERIARGSHPTPEPHVLAFGLREWEAGKARYAASGLRDRFAFVERVRDGDPVAL